MIETTKLILASLTLIGQALFVLTVILLCTPWRKKVWDFFGTHGLWFSFIVSLVALCGSLFFSEVAHYDPCKLCWIQRIAIFPLVFMFWQAIVRKDAGIWKYAIVHSVFGLFVSGYHYLLQLDVVPNVVGCSAVGVSISCNTLKTLSFGYITIPLMAFTTCLLITGCLIAVRRKGVSGK